MTSGFIAMLKLDFRTAYECNVLSPLLFVGTVLYGFVLICDIIFDKNNIERVEKIMSKPYMYIVYVTVLALETVLNNCSS